MPFAVLKDFHPMIGYDLHIPWPIGSPAPLPAPVPYFCFHLLCGWKGTYQRAVSHSTSWGALVQKGSDIGPGIPHIGTPSYLLPLDILFSASKSYWGTTEYKAEGKPAAVCIIPYACINLNLNCGTPFPKRPGIVIAFNTHYAGMTWGDFFHGLLSFAIDWALQWLFNKLLGKLSDKIANRFLNSAMTKAAAKDLLRGTVKQKVINQMARELAAANRARADAFLKIFPAFMRPSREAANPILNNAVGAVSGFLFGGPLGMDANGAFGWWTPGGATTSGAQDYLNNNVVDEFGKPPPPPPQPPPTPRRPPSIGPAPPPVCRP
ncbi:hypothetical protein [Nannocystis pusilla]|uniref:hypothetical protein n=1 Tax=Nannocystis pusilla TaxID=889268 RepID=UPI003DA514E7